MVLSLVGNVLFHGVARRWTDGERGVSLLPRKSGFADLLMDPDRRRLFQLAHEVGQTVRRLQAHQQMHVIGNTASPLRHASQSRDRAPKVLVQSIDPCFLDEWGAIFGAEY